MSVSINIRCSLSVSINIRGSLSVSINIRGSLSVSINIRGSLFFHFELYSGYIDNRMVVGLSHNVVSSTPRLSGIRTHNVSGDRH
jgi:hypothetical protein